MADSPARLDPPVPERRTLEDAFWQVRWLAIAAIAALTLLSGFHLAAIGAAVAALTLGNLAVGWANRRASTLSAQRLLGVAATAMDAVVVLGLAVAAPEEAAAPTYAALLVVVAETAMRFAPLKALAGAGMLIAGLAVAMGLRSLLTAEPFDLRLLAVLGVLVLLAGTMVGSVVREIYRQRVASSPPPAQRESAPTQAQALQTSLAEEALALLTPRERQVMTLIAQGYSNAQIAAALVVEQKTVKNHINNIYGKLRLNSRYEAIISMLGRQQPNGEQSQPTEASHADS